MRNGECGMRNKDCGMGKAGNRDGGQAKSSAIAAWCEPLPGCEGASARTQDISKPSRPGGPNSKDPQHATRFCLTNPGNLIFY